MRSHRFVGCRLSLAASTSSLFYFSVQKKNQDCFVIMTELYQNLLERATHLEVYSRQQAVLNCMGYPRGESRSNNPGVGNHSRETTRPKKRETGKDDVGRRHGKYFCPSAPTRDKVPHRVDDDAISSGNRAGLFISQMKSVNKKYST
ncbi:hypothetical protein B0O99DRAFT_249147 [Bisporella sp. PMI_857]|nr:hypothetical protein B0O99DRAFT_249147 [Bisporella sp. PMI_857]